MSKNDNSLFNLTVGQQNATWKALEDAGLTIPACKVIRSNTDAANAMVAALAPFLRPTNPHPERHYDLSAILSLADPLQNIVWPEVELAENQFLVAYRGEAPSQVLPGSTTNEVYVWDQLPKFNWWQQGVKPGICRVTLPLRGSGGVAKAEKAELCRKHGGQMTPFVINAMVRLAHKVYTGEQIGGWTLCPEPTRSDLSADLSWNGAQLRCVNYWDVFTNDDLLASSLERLSNLETAS